MEKNKIFNYIIIIIFIAFLWIPTIGMIFKTDIGTPINEKRTFAEPPALKANFKSILRFSQRFINYYKDNFGFRNLLLRTHISISKDIYKKPFIKTVLFGKDNWLFYSDDNTISQYRGLNLFSHSELEKYTKILNHHYDYCKKNNILFLYTIIPNKSTVYPEKLPYWYKRIYKKTHLDLLAEYISKHSSLKIIDLRELFIKAKKEKLIYQATDTHWNDYGAYLGYRTLGKIIKEEYPGLKLFQLSDFTIEDKITDGGDLTILLGLENVIKQRNIIFTPKFHKTYRKVEVDKFYKDRYPRLHKLNVLITENKNKNLPNAVIFRDSFTTPLMTYFSSKFSRVVYIWPVELDLPIYFDKAVVDKEQPDIVMSIISERYIPSLVRLKLSN